MSRHPGSAQYTQRESPLLTVPLQHRGGGTGCPWAYSQGLSSPVLGFLPSSHRGKPTLSSLSSPCTLRPEKATESASLGHSI